MDRFPVYDDIEVVTSGIRSKLAEHDLCPRCTTFMSSHFSEGALNIGEPVANHQLHDRWLMGIAVRLFFGIDGVCNARRFLIAVKAEDTVTNREIRCSKTFQLAEIINP